MKRIWWVFFGLTVLAMGAGSAYGTPYIIDDNPLGPNTYWGGTVLGEANQDVLVYFDSSRYDFSKMEISFTGTVVKVKVFADFTRPDNDYGDLYLSSKGWKVSGTDPHHKDDTFTPDEGWDYVITRQGLSLTGKGVYSMDFGRYLEMTNNRRNQAWRGGYGTYIETAEVTLAADSTTFEFDTAKLGLGATFGLHFTQSCGNDVIEGEVPGVPEPATLLLLGFGLAGLGMIKMRKRT